MSLTPRLVAFPLVLLALAVPAIAKDGDLDTTFGTGGRVVTDFDGGTYSVSLTFGVEAQTDNKLLVTGWVGALSDAADASALRLLPNGNLDTSWGSSGRVETGFGTGTADEIFASLLQPDGKLILGGFTAAALGGLAPQDLLLLRLNTNGALDSTFGTGGRVKTDLGSTTDWVVALARQSDGKILTGSLYGPLNGPWDFAVARYQANGILDTSFGTGGKVVTDFVGNDRVAGLTVQPDGKILAVGISGPEGLTSASSLVMARYNANGSLDTSFGTAGKVSTKLGLQGAGGIRIALLSGGKFLVGGGGLGPSGTPDFMLARFNANGSVDTTYASGGKVLTDFGGKQEYLNEMLVQADGKIVLTGEVNTTTVGSHDGSFGAARYTASGALDTTFGTGGKVTVTFPGTTGSRGTAASLATDGKIVIAGHVFTSDLFHPERVGVVRLQNGTVDTSPCVPGATTLCLGANDRFEVTATYNSPTSGSGAAHIFDLTTDTGYLWFFASSNVEEIVKVVNGCGVNGHFWFFAAGLTNVDVVTRVRDTHTGAVVSTENPQNTPFQPVQNTSAFAGCTVADAADTEVASEAEAAADFSGDLRQIAASSTQLLLNNNRFRVEVAWQTPTASGNGQAVPLTADTGYFWFFAASNVEMLVKVLDGCSLNNHYWVFAGGLTNVHTTMTVTDTANGQHHAYSNPQGTAFRPLQNTTDFATCP